MIENAGNPWAFSKECNKRSTMCVDMRRETFMNLKLVMLLSMLAELKRVISVCYRKFTISWILSSLSVFYCLEGSGQNPYCSAVRHRK
jgi:hypothetical protein